VLSDSTRGIDLLLKRERLQRARRPAYWVIDADVPCLTVMELDEDTYRDVGSFTGSESYRTTVPYDVTVVPTDLTAL
jgi:Putative restriction endonuclease